MEATTAPPDWRSAVASAITQAGGKTALMRRLNGRGHEIKSHSVIAQWVANGVPAKYCPDIEAITGVSCEQLCPDVRWGLVRNRRANRTRKTDATPSTQKAS